MNNLSEKSSYNETEIAISGIVLGITILTHLFTFIEFINYNNTHHGTTIRGMEYIWGLIGIIVFSISILLQYTFYYQVKKIRYPILCIVIQVILLLFALLIAFGIVAA